MAKSFNATRAETSVTRFGSTLLLRAGMLMNMAKTDEEVRFRDGTYKWDEARGDLVPAFERPAPVPPQQGSSAQPPAAGWEAEIAAIKARLDALEER